jgi:two-component system, cell cycle sensor histidine kinase PleC
MLNWKNLIDTTLSPADIAPEKITRVCETTRLSSLTQILPQVDDHGVLVVINALGEDIGVVNLMRLSHALARELMATRNERDTARRALAQTDEARGLFFASLSHELRTPLNAITGYSEWLLARDNPKINTPQQQEKCLNSILSASQHMLGMLDCVLEMARLRAQQVELKAEPIALSTIVDTTFQLLMPTARARNMQLLSKGLQMLPQIITDPGILRQILLNLVSNAIKYGRQGTRVHITARLLAKGDLRIEVRDQGPGIPAHALAKLMRPFHRLDAHDLADGPKGAGLGLALVKLMVELQDGDFKLVSQAGKGTRAIVTLPAARVLQTRPIGHQGAFCFTRLANLA